MDNVTWLTEQVIALAAGIGGNFLYDGFWYGMLGVLLGILLVLFLRKRGLMRRPNLLWGWLTKLQYLFIPLLLGALVGTFASISSVRSTLDSWVEGSTTELKNYAESYIPEVERIAGAMAASGNTSEKALRQQILGTGGAPDNSVARTFFYSVNRKIIGYFLNTMGLEDNAGSVSELAEPGYLTRLNQASLNSMSTYVKSGLIAPYANGAYWILIIFFIPFLLISLVDFVLLMINQRAKSAIQRGIASYRDKRASVSED